jgi:hypothetical protein
MAPRLAMTPLFVALAAPVVFSVPAAGAFASACTSAKVKTAGKFTAALGKCRAKAIADGSAVDSACTQKATARFLAGFAKADAMPDCLGETGDAAAIRAVVEGFIPDVHQAVNGGGAGPNKCDGKKVQAATKKAAAKALCHAKPIRKGIPVEATCLAKAESGFAKAITKLEKPGNACTSQSQGPTLEALVDAFVAELISELTTYTECGCPAQRYELTSTPGILAIGTLPAFPFPAGVVTRVDSGAANAECEHASVVPPGGFSVPVFCVPALGFTSELTATGCASGSGHGAGVVWDAAACADADVAQVGDTSDPSTNSCATLGGGCTVMSGGAGDDTAGNVDTTRGDGACDASGVGIRVEIPARSRTWNDAVGNCPDEDGVFDPGTDFLVTEFDLVLRATTASSNAEFADLNGDACMFAGHGPDHPKHCSDDPSRPCQTNAHCTAPATCLHGPLVGVPPVGPCCNVGQTTTLVSTGFAFTGNAPLYDVIFAARLPNTVTACGASAGNTCTPTIDVCRQ